MIEMNQIKDTTPEVAQAWSDTFQSTLDFYDIEPHNIYNMDESGFCCRNSE